MGLRRLTDGGFRLLHLLQKEDLPEGWRHQDTADVIRHVGQRVVKIYIPRMSRERPAGIYTDREDYGGTGFAFHVGQDFVKVRTSMHVLYNAEEARAATVEFSLRVPGSCSSSPTIIRLQGTDRDFHRCANEDYTSITCYTTSLLRQHLQLFVDYPVLWKHDGFSMDSSATRTEANSSELKVNGPDFQCEDYIVIMAHPGGDEKSFSIGPAVSSCRSTCSTVHAKRSTNSKVAEDVCDCDDNKINVKSDDSPDVLLGSRRHCLYRARTTQGCSGAPVLLLKRSLRHLHLPVVDNSQHSGTCYFKDGVTLGFSTPFAPSVLENVVRILYFSSACGPRPAFPHVACRRDDREAVSDTWSPGTEQDRASQLWPVCQSQAQGKRGADDRRCDSQQRQSLENRSPSKIMLAEMKSFSDKSSWKYDSGSSTRCIYLYRCQLAGECPPPTIGCSSPHGHLELEGYCCLEGGSGQSRPSQRSRSGTLRDRRQNVPPRFLNIQRSLEGAEEMNATYVTKPSAGTTLFRRTDRIVVRNRRATESESTGSDKENASSSSLCLDSREFRKANFSSTDVRIATRDKFDNQHAGSSLTEPRQGKRLGGRMYSDQRARRSLFPNANLRLRMKTNTDGTSTETSSSCESSCSSSSDGGSPEPDSPEEVALPTRGSPRHSSPLPITGRNRLNALRSSSLASRRKYCRSTGRDAEGVSSPDSSCHMSLLNTDSSSDWPVLSASRSGEVSQTTESSSRASSAVFSTDVESLELSTESESMCYASVLKSTNTIHSDSTTYTAGITDAPGFKTGNQNLAADLWQNQLQSSKSRKADCARSSQPPRESKLSLLGLPQKHLARPERLLREAKPGDSTAYYFYDSSQPASHSGLDKREWPAFSEPLADVSDSDCSPQRQEDKPVSSSERHSDAGCSPLCEGYDSSRQNTPSTAKASVSSSPHSAARTVSHCDMAGEEIFVFPSIHDKNAPNLSFIDKETLQPSDPDNGTQQPRDVNRETRQPLSVSEEGESAEAFDNSSKTGSTSPACLTEEEERAVGVVMSLMQTAMYSTGGGVTVCVQQPGVKTNTVLEKEQSLRGGLTQEITGVFSEPEQSQKVESQSLDIAKNDTNVKVAVCTSQITSVPSETHCRDTLMKDAQAATAINTQMVHYTSPLENTFPQDFCHGEQTDRPCKAPALNTGSSKSTGSLVAQEEKSKEETVYRQSPDGLSGKDASEEYVAQITKGKLGYGLSDTQPLARHGFRSEIIKTPIPKFDWLKPVDQISKFAREEKSYLAPATLKKAPFRVLVKTCKDLVQHRVSAAEPDSPLVFTDSVSDNIDWSALQPERPETCRKDQTQEMPAGGTGPFSVTGKFAGLCDMFGFMKTTKGRFCPHPRALAYGAGDGEVRSQTGQYGLNPHMLSYLTEPRSLWSHGEFHHHVFYSGPPLPRTPSDGQMPHFFVGAPGFNRQGQDEIHRLRFPYSCTSNIDARRAQRIAEASRMKGTPVQKFLQRPSAHEIHSVAVNQTRFSPVQGLQSDSTGRSGVQQPEIGDYRFQRKQKSGPRLGRFLSKEGNLSGISDEPQNVFSFDDNASPLFPQILPQPYQGPIIQRNPSLVAKDEQSCSRRAPRAMNGIRNYDLHIEDVITQSQFCAGDREKRTDFMGQTRPASTVQRCGPPCLGTNEVLRVVLEMGPGFSLQKAGSSASQCCQQGQPQAEYSLETSDGNVGPSPAYPASEHRAGAFSDAFTNNFHGTMVGLSALPPARVTYADVASRIGTHETSPATADIVYSATAPGTPQTAFSLRQNPQTGAAWLQACPADAKQTAAQVFDPNWVCKSSSRCQSLYSELQKMPTVQEMRSADFYPRGLPLFPLLPPSSARSSERETSSDLTLHGDKAESVLAQRNPSLFTQQDFYPLSRQPPPLTLEHLSGQQLTFSCDGAAVGSPSHGLCFSVPRVVNSNFRSPVSPRTSRRFGLSDSLAHASVPPPAATPRKPRGSPYDPPASPFRTLPVMPTQQRVFSFEQPGTPLSCRALPGTPRTPLTTATPCLSSCPPLSPLVFSPGGCYAQGAPGLGSARGQTPGRRQAQEELEEGDRQTSPVPRRVYLEKVAEWILSQPFDTAFQLELTLNAAGIVQ